MSAEGEWPWSLLGLQEAPQDPKEIRRAYARQLKQIDQKTEIARFDALREAYAVALDLRESLTPKSAPPAPAPVAPQQDLAQPEPTQPDPPEPDLTDADLAQSAALLALLHPSKPGTTLAERVKTVLGDQLSLAPQNAEALRRAVAQAIRQASQPGLSERNLPVSLDGPLIYWLDLRYGWLSDYAAFSRDFGNDYELLEIMASRAFPAPVPPTAAPPRRRSRFESTLDSLFTHGPGRYGLFLGLMVLTHLGPTHLRTSNQADQIEVLLLHGVAAIGLAYLYLKLRHGKFRQMAPVICGWLGLGVLSLDVPTGGGPASPVFHPGYHWLAITALVLSVWLAIWLFKEMRRWSWR